MNSAADLALFAHLVSRPESELDLVRAALLIAEPEYPNLDVPSYVGLLDRWGEEARRAARHGSPDTDSALSSVLALVYGELGFHGNDHDYYDPRNSFLNEVLDRRTGIPITLALVLIEICRRAGVEAAGVAFPGHFLVRSPVPGGFLVIDPFRGRPIAGEELLAIHQAATGGSAEIEPTLLEPATKSQILLRLLGNLRGIYQTRSDRTRLGDVIERMLILEPSDELRAELESLDRPRPRDRRPN
jgi:regulator of sirC expression with transglutaminase-like and TPR domain